MTRGEGSTRTLVVVAVVGVGLLCGIGGAVATVLWYSASADRSDVERERAARLAEQAARKRAWLASLPTDERTAIHVFDQAEETAVELVRGLANGSTPVPEDPAMAAAARTLRELAGGAEPVSLSSPTAETIEQDDGRISAVKVDVVVEWGGRAPTTVRVTLDRAADGTLTASTIEIVDAAESD